MGGAVIQLAHWRRCRVIGVDRRVPPDSGTASRPDVFIDADDAALVDRVRDATAGRGADVAFNAVGGAAFETHLHLLVRGGRMAVISSVGQRHVSFDLLDFYHERLTLAGVDSRQIGEAESARILEHLVPGFDGGALHAPPIAKRVALADAREAYAAVRDGSCPERWSSSRETSVTARLRRSSD